MRERAGEIYIGRENIFARICRNGKSPAVRTGLRFSRDLQVARHRLLAATASLHVRFDFHTCPSPFWILTFKVKWRCHNLGFEAGDRRPSLIKATTRGGNLHGAEKYFRGDD